MSMLKILIIVTNVGVYANSNLATGLWLSELTHLYHAAEERGYAVTIASPKGGDIPVDPESLKHFTLDQTSKRYWNEDSFRKLLNNSKRLTEVADEDYDLIYLAGGHGTMYDFPDDLTIQSIIKTQYESGKNVAAICHGVRGLLNVKLSNGEYLIKGKTITGFDWFEETIAGRKKKVPFNLEAAIKARGANLKKAFVPMTSNVEVDGHLITGHNPFISKEMAKIVVRQLEGK